MHAAGEELIYKICNVMATKAVVEDQKKRALDALERRFAVAKAEAQHQVRDKRKRQDPFSKSGPGSSSVGPSVKASPAFVQKYFVEERSFALSL